MSIRPQRKSPAGVAPLVFLGVVIPVVVAIAIAVLSAVSA